MTNLFIGKKSYSQGELRRRNSILIFTETLLWIISIIITLKVLLGIDMVFGIQTKWYWIAIMLIQYLLLFRFKIWSIDFKSKKYHADGIDWVVNDYKNRADQQTKFFTCREHKDGSRNPLW